LWPLGDLSHHRTVTRPRGPLAHPLFWLALVLLLLNDHVLKQSQVLPGAVTGKLSDFAGLLVASVLLSALLKVRGRLGRLSLFAGVSGAFATLKLSRPFADAVETITAFGPLPWRLWCDPTDLVALSVLPLGWWLVAREGEPRRTRLGPCLRAAGLVLGVFACAATSVNSKLYRATAFLFNGTRTSQTLQLYRLRAPLDCGRALDAPAVWPGPEAFALESCTTIAPADILLLDQGARLVSETGGEGLWFTKSPYYDAGIVGPLCDAVLLQGPGLRPVVVTWNGVSQIEFGGPERFGDFADDEHGLILEAAGDRLFIKGTSLLRVLPAGFEPAPTDCPNGER
jgi:hypothetical protein